MIGLDNLIDLIILCIDHPAAAGKTFLVSDGEDLSTPDLINHIAHSMGRSARLFPMSISLLRLLGRILNRKEDEIAVICHGGVIRSVLSHLLKTPLEVTRSYHIHYTGFVKFVNTKEGWRLSELNSGEL